MKSSAFEYHFYQLEISFLFIISAVVKPENRRFAFVTMETNQISFHNWPYPFQLSPS